MVYNQHYHMAHNNTRTTNNSTLLSVFLVTNEPLHEKIGVRFSTRHDTNRSIQRKKVHVAGIYAANTNALISCAVNVNLICVFVFAL